MSDAQLIRQYFSSWGISLPGEPNWHDWISLVEKIALNKKGFFLFKIDGERGRNKYSFVLNLPRPVDLVCRKDTDHLDEGPSYIVRELIQSNVHP